MADTVVFAGPSLPTTGQADGFAWLPPVARGDVLIAIETHRPRRIAVIDGWIHDRPSVTHKEIIFALGRGIAVYGAAGMGAIRAVELAGFGMVGVGDVFTAYKDGFLSRDDEVAVTTTVEGSAATVPLVDVRRTLAEAASERLLTPEAASALLKIAGDMHYSVRTYARIVDVAGNEPALAHPSAALRDWLPTGTRSVKTEDARQLITQLCSTIDDEYPPPSRLAETEAWHVLHRRYGASLDDGKG